MSPIQDGAWKPRKGAITSKSGVFDGHSQWETSVLVKKANKYVKLIDILKEYKIKIIPNGRDEWSKPICCPFPNHKDGTPSFGYNYKTDSFNCFVCGAGRAVEFLSKRSKEPIRKVAVFLLNNVNINPYEKDALEINESKIINEKIIEFLLFISSKFQTHKSDSKKIEYFEKLMWYFDSFITRSFDRDDFSVRIIDSEISRLKELFQQIEED